MEAVIKSRSAALLSVFVRITTGASSPSSRISSTSRARGRRKRRGERGIDRPEVFTRRGALASLAGAISRCRGIKRINAACTSLPPIFTYRRLVGYKISRPFMEYFSVTSREAENKATRGGRGNFPRDAHRSCGVDALTHCCTRAGACARSLIPQRVTSPLRPADTEYPRNFVVMRRRRRRRRRRGRTAFAYRSPESRVLRSRRFDRVLYQTYALIATIGTRSRS